MDPLNRRGGWTWFKPNNICMPDNPGDHKVKENSDLVRERERDREKQVPLNVHLAPELHRNSDLACLEKFT
jgi:hypothetical protein